MAGGRGTRFWPASVSNKPKQYLNLISGKSLLRESIERFSNLILNENLFVATVKKQESLVSKIVSKSQVIFEPQSKNTAPTILFSLATMAYKGIKEDSVIVVSPSDHCILNKYGFEKTIKLASSLAKDNIIVIGIKPDSPHTGFGYIQVAKKLNDNVFKVDNFKEKPKKEIARQYINEGNYYWNSGMFIGKLKTFLKQFSIHSKDLYRFYEDIYNSIEDYEKLENIYKDIPSESIDYAIIEKTKDINMLIAQFDWNDLGSWDSLEKVIKSSNGNTIVDAREVHTQNAKGNIVYAQNKFVSLNYVDNLVVVTTDSSVMIIPKDRAQDVRNIIDYLKQENKDDLL